MSFNKLYPDNTIQELLPTDYVASATRAAIEPRLATDAVTPAYFSAENFRLLTTLCRHLLALEDEAFAACIAAGIDERLAADKSNGWRYQQMPGDRDVYKLALQALDDAAQAGQQSCFTDLPEAQQLALLHQLQKGEKSGDGWNKLSPALFFEELLSEATEIFYSHPYAQNEIGFVGMADAHGWKKLGLNEQEQPEAEPIYYPHP